MTPAQELANTILQQLGGNKFCAMTGSKNFVATGRSLRMSLTRNESGANFLEVHLDEWDTYCMHFYWAGMTKAGVRYITKAKWEGVYADGLQDIFTEVTGLDTHI